MYRAREVRYAKYRFVRTNVLFAVLASDFGVELVVGEGPFREPPTVMQATIVRPPKGLVWWKATASSATT